MNDTHAFRLETLSLNNYRKFETFEISFDDCITVLVGDNSAGKTSILDAACIALGTFLTSFEGAAGPTIMQGDVRYAYRKVGSSSEKKVAYPVDISAEGVILGKPMRWKRSLNGSKSRTTIKDASEVVKAGKAAHTVVSEGDGDCVLPVLVRYSTDRLWSQSATRGVESEKYESNRVNGYEQCLHASANEARITTWFRKMSLWEWQNRAESPEFSSVKNALAFIFKEASSSEDVEVDFDVQTGELVLAYTDAEGVYHRDPVGSMGDGCRCTINLVADIARRMAMLNPSLGDKVLEAPGVVLVDEVDLHLHPLWQAKVLGDLRRVFPNVQFIVTTHAPVVVSSVLKENVRVFDGSRAVLPAAETFGHDANSVLDVVLGGNSRPAEVQRRFRQFESLMDAEDYDRAQKVLDDIEAAIGPDDSELVACRTSLALERL